MEEDQQYMICLWCLYQKPWREKKIKRQTYACVDIASLKT